MTIQFNYRLIGWECNCGHPREFVKTGITSLGGLIACWQCSKCERHVSATIPFEQLIIDLPAHPGKPVAIEQMPPVTEKVQ